MVSKLRIIWKQTVEHTTAEANSGDEAKEFVAAAVAQALNSNNDGTYEIDAEVVPDLLRKALEIYKQHGDKCHDKLLAVHTALGQHYVATLDSVFAAKQRTAAASASAAGAVISTVGGVVAKRLRGKVERAASHLERAVAMAAELLEHSGGQAGAAELVHLSIELCRLHRRVPASGILQHEAEEAEGVVRQALSYLFRLRPILQVRASNCRLLYVNLSRAWFFQSRVVSMPSSLAAELLEELRATLKEAVRVVAPAGADASAASAAYKGGYRLALLGVEGKVDDVLEQVCYALMH